MTQTPVADTAPSSASFADLDHLFTAQVGRFTGGLSPASLLLAWTDWATHLAAAPGKRLDLALRLGRAPDADAVVADPRFAAPVWQQPPYRQWAEAFLRLQDWWREATHGVAGTSAHHEALVAFAGRQLLDMWAPSNLAWANPEVLQRTQAQAGLNLWQGGLRWWQDLQRTATGQPPEGMQDFVVGRDLAATPGKVVLRNHLIELIQYSPTTPTVQAEPVLLVPAWIMKYYILDLSPHNSLVRWLVAQGHTVFCISWRNVDEADRELGMDDYRQLGVMAALDAIGAICPEERVHGVGYCLGGTLLSIAAAAMARAQDERLASLTLLAAQTDFSEPGELALFIDPSQLHMLDSLMWRRGVLTAEQMSGAFQMLQSRDLIWSRLVHDYLMGEPAPLIDLMAWNADTTRMPYRMHSDYLHQLFLDNDLAAGRYRVDGQPLALQNLRLPIFAVGTERDHVAPWKSVYKIHYLCDAPVTFALTNGGHNAGIVSEPGHAHRHYRLATRPAGGACVSADEWQAAAQSQDGSWWPAWQAWLLARGSGRLVAPPRLGGKGRRTLDDAPGRYVLQR